MEKLRSEGVRVPPMPPNPAPHITDRLIEIGLSEAAGMGVAPLSWKEIAAWSQMTAVELAPWEAKLLRRLSADYLAESRRAEAEGASPPWRPPVTRQEMAAEIRALANALG